MKCLVGRGALSALIVASLVSCGGPRSESLDLSNAILAAAQRLQRGADGSTEVTYELKVGKASVVVIAPRAGIDIGQLPSGVTDAQVDGLRRAVAMWKDHEFVAISWESGVSAGNSIDRTLGVLRQYAILKPPYGSITVRLERSDSGDVRIADLR